MKVRAYVTSAETPDLSLCPDLSVSRSLPRLELLRKGMDHRLTKSIAHPALPQALSEIDEVVGLSQWPRKSEGGKPAHAELTQFRERFGDIEKILSERKGKFSLPSLNSLPGLDRICLDVTRRRAEKVNQEQELQAKLSHSRHFEEELITTETATNARLQSLNNQREALRKHNTFIRTQLTMAELKAQEAAASSLGSLKDLRHLFKSTSTLRPRNFAQLPQFKSAMNCTDETREGFGVDRDRAVAEIAQNSKKAKDVDALVKKTKEELNAIRNAQISHYYAVLKEGKDTRSEGLLWVVKQLWSKGQKPTLEHFPAFLEDMTIATIIELAELSSEIDQLQVQIDTLNKDKKGVLVFARSHPDKWNGVQKRLESIGKTTTLSKEVTTETLTNTRPPLSRFESLNPTTGESAEEKIRMLESQCQQVEELMGIIRLNEQKRLLHECCFNKLEKRLGGSMKEMLSAVIGQDTVKRQASVLAKEQLILTESQRRTKTYRFGRRRSQE